MSPPDPLQAVRRKAHARLAPLTDPARARHKPLSLLRMEVRRLLEQYLVAECPTLPQAERSRLADEVLAEAPGLGPLEDLFRDPAVQEVMVLAPGQVVVRKGDAWTPTSVRFRDAEHVRRMLARYAEVGEPVAPPAAGGFDVWLGNGFRAVAVLPPEVLELPPTAVFVRGAPPSAPPPVSQPTPRPVAEEAPTVRVPPPTEQAGPHDPYTPVRQQVTRRIVTRLAAAGVHDLTRIPLPELRKIVLAYVEEVCEAERLWSDAAFRERLALEILATMKR
jgi:pilus assembly protein CpaF